MYQRMRLERLGSNSKKLPPACEIVLPSRESTPRPTGESIKYCLYQAVKDNSLSDLLKIIQDRKHSLGHETLFWVLTLAAKYGLVQFAQAMIDNGVGVNEQDCNGNSGLILAARYGQQNVLNYLLRSNADPNLCNEITKRQALHLACEYGHSECVEILLTGTVDVNEVDGTNEPPIVLASRHGHTIVATVLIEAKCDVEKPSHNDILRRRALHYAAAADHTQVVDVLLSAGALPDVSDGAGNTPLLLAVAANNLAVSNVLIKHKADVNHRNSLGLSPVIIACSEGFSEVLELLLQNEADPNTVNHMGDPAILVATRNKHENCARVLIEHGCDLNLFNPKHGRSALYWAIDNKMTELVEFMIHSDADINAGTLGLPLEAAVRKRNAKIVDMLLEKGVNVNKRVEPEQATALMYAMDCSFSDIAKKLLNAGADPNAETVYNVTALMLGQKKPGKDNVLKKLIEKGVNINYKALRGYSAIYPDNVKTLLNSGTNSNTTNEAGDSPLLKAALYNRREVARLLICSNCDIDRKGKCYTPCQMALLHARSFRIVRMLIAAGCDLSFVFLWEKTCFPETLEVKPERISWLLKKAAEPKTLSQICRKTILNALGIGTCSAQKIDALDLPRNFTKYLKYSEFNRKHLDDYDGGDDSSDDVFSDDDDDDDNEDDDDTGSVEGSDSSSSSDDCVIS